VTTAGWDDDPAVASWPGLPALDGDTGADACVVGLGASGLAAVRALVERGLAVVGIDAGRVAGGAAGRNGGFLLAGPWAPLHTAIAAWGAEAAVGLYRATLAELDALGDLPRRVGSMRIAGLPGAPDDTELGDCAGQATAMRAYGFPVEPYEGPLGQGLFFPADAAVNPAARAIAQAAQLSGRARMYEHTRALEVRPGKVVTDAGVVSAQVVVVAVDGGLERLLPGLVPGVRTARLQMLATAPVASRVPCPAYCRWGYDYAQQAPDGRLFVGGGRDLFREDEWTDSTAPTQQVQHYIETVATRFAAGPVRVTHRWAASVGFTDDGRPLCALVDDGVVAVGGYSGTGNLVGPVAACAGVAYVLDGTAPPPWAATGSGTMTK
jgi:glycine/D-amino acid oxidase-like deaminating enzyme